MLVISVCALEEHVPFVCSEGDNCTVLTILTAAYRNIFVLAVMTITSTGGISQNQVRQMTSMYEIARNM
jgi:hypothetical protein